MEVSYFEHLRIFLPRVDVTIILSAIHRSFGSVIKIDRWVVTMAKSIAKSVGRVVAVEGQEETTVAKPKRLSLAFAAFPWLAGLNSIPQITEEATMS